MIPRRPLPHLSLLLLAAALSACAQPDLRLLTPGRLAPEAGRITDEMIDRDRQQFAEALRRHHRLAAAPSAALVPSAYALAKARCWLQAGERQYARNDRSGFPDAALQEALELLDAVETQAVIPTRTPLIDGASRLREDLRSGARELMSHPGLACAAASVACAEVALVLAGDRHAEFGPHAAQDHLQHAEELIGRAGREAAACVSPSDEPVVPASAPLPGAARSGTLAQQAAGMRAAH